MLWKETWRETREEVVREKENKRLTLTIHRNDQESERGKGEEEVKKVSKETKISTLRI